MVTWADNHQKGRAAEVLLMETMSSEDSCYEADEDGKEALTSYKIKKLPWESTALRKIKKQLDKKYNKRLSKRARDRIVPRTVAKEQSERDPPEIPEWALNAQASDLDTSTSSSV